MKQQDFNNAAAFVFQLLPLGEHVPPSHNLSTILFFPCPPSLHP